MSNLVLGVKPHTLTVPVHRRSDFIATRRLVDAVGQPQPFAPGATLDLVFADGTVWAATITADHAVWNIDKARVAQLIDSDVLFVDLVYTEGTADVVWATGVVDRG